MKPLVAVITPTYNRDNRILEQCINTVQWQTHSNILHIVCHDGPWSANFLPKENWQGIITNTPERTNSYGAGVRQYVLDTFIKNIPDVKYLVHLDDDNIIFPRYVEEHVNYLEENKDVDFTVCKIVHNGPIPVKFGKPPQILTGVPPVYLNIDTLQVVVRTEAMIKCKWTCYTGRDGYCNDGYTYERLGKLSKWAELPKLLGIHL
jgi:glycosyltransferase involved in cell wall biosynthesis